MCPCAKFEAGCRCAATSIGGRRIRRRRRAACARDVFARIAVSLLAAVLVGASAAVPASVDAQVARGEITDLEVTSEAAGELTLRWTPPADPVEDPSDYRIGWASDGEDFRTWTDLDWNVFPAAPLDAASGQISIRADAMIDFESRASYQVLDQVTVSKDSAGEADTTVDDMLVLVMDVTDVNEAGVVVVPGGLVPGVVLSAVVSDPDGAVSGVVVAPSVPREVRVVSGLGAVTVSWEPSQSNGGAQLSYEYRSAKGSTVGGGVSWLDAGDALEVAVGGLETGAVSGELYTLEVRARNEAGHSDAVTVRGRPLPRQYWRWVSFGQYQHSVEEGGDAATVRVRLQTRMSSRVEVPVVVSYHGGATSDDVYEVVGSVVFEPGERERTLRVRAVDDRVDDDGEWVGLGFGDLPAGLQANGPNGSARVSIVDSVDDVPGISAGFVQASMSAREGQRVTPTLTLTAAPEVPVFQTRPTPTVASWLVRLELSWTSSLGHGPGRFGGQASSWVRFDAGHMSRSIDVLCPDDQVRGAAHSITVEIDSAWLEGVSEHLAAPIPLELTSGNRRLVINCTEDDTADPPDTAGYPTVTAAISTTDAQPAVVHEAGETSAELAVTLSADPGRDEWIPLRVTADGADSSDFDFGTSLENGVLRYAPFRPSDGVHRFGDDHIFPYVLFRAGGPLIQTFRVWAQDDRHHDPDEAIEIALGNLPARITGTGTGSVRVRINDDDPAPAVTPDTSVGSPAETGTPQASAHSVPVFSVADYPGGAVARSLAEDAGSGVLGAVVTATDADGDTLAYSVEATADAQGAAHLPAFDRDFELDSATGQISVRPGALIDFESRSVYRVVYGVSDGEDSSGSVEPVAAIDDSLTLTVSVTNVNEAGVVTISGIARVGETLTAALSDPDGTASSVVWQWSRSDTSSGPFADVTANAAAATYIPVAADKDKFLQATAAYTDDTHSAAGQNAAAATAAAIGASAHSVPVFSVADYPGGAVARSLAEDAGSGVLGAVVTATDADGDTLAYSVEATADAQGAAHLPAFDRDFELDSATGQISVRPGALIDFESRSVYRVVYGVSDGEDSSGSVEPVAAIDDSLTLTVSVTNVNEAGVVTISGIARVGETLTAALSDPDGTASSVVWQWSRSDTSSGPFADVTANAAAATYIPVAADKDKFLQATAAYTDDTHSAAGQNAAAATAAAIGASAHSVPVFSVADYPGGAVARSLAEDAGSGVLGAVVTATDADGDTLAYSVEATADAQGAAHLPAFDRDFELDSATGQISVRPGALIDFESRSVYRVVYGVSDGEDSSGSVEPVAAIDDSLTLTVSVTNVNEAGVVTISGIARVGETLTAALSDPDGTASSVVWQWSRSDTSSGPFADVTANAAAATYIPVAADKDKFLQATAAYTDDTHSAAGQNAAAATAAAIGASAHSVPVFSVADYPGGAVARSLAEDAGSGVLGAVVTATDADGDTLAYSVEATADAQGAAHLPAFDRDFELDSATGQISVRPGALIDFESRSVYRVVYGVSDGEDSSGSVEPVAAIDDSLTLTVSVTNVNEAGVVTISGIARVGETLTAALSDPDGTASSVVWQWSRSDTSSGPFADVTANAAAATYIPVAADKDKFLQATAAYTDDTHSAAGQNAAAATAAAIGASAHSVPVFSVADYPGGAVARSLAEDAGSGVLGAVVTATDADGDTLAYSVEATADAQGAAHLPAFDRDFELDSATGQISVRPGALIDFESRSVYRVVYGVSDGEDSSGSVEPVAAIDDSLTLTVSVTNVNEAGVVTISGIARVGETLTAALSDPDGTASSVVWQWSRSDTSSGPFADVTANAAAATYIPVAADKDKFLQATAAYTDDTHSAAGQNAAAATAAVTEASVPGHLHRLTLEANNTKIVASWPAPRDDGGRPVTAYQVQWRDPAIQTDWDSLPAYQTVSVTGISHTISGLTNGTLYQVRVAAVNSVGTGPWSFHSEATPETTAPEPPEMPALLPVNKEIGASWDTPDDGGSPNHGVHGSVAEAGHAELGVCRGGSPDCFCLGHISQDRRVGQR